MADPSALSSLSWLLNYPDFNALLEAGTMDRRALELIIVPEALDRVYSGCKQFIYWKKKLQMEDSDNIITVALIGSSGLIKPDIRILQDIFVSIIGPGRIQMINYPENTNLITFVFKDTEAAQLLRHRVVTVDGALALFFSNKKTNVFRVRILWSPLFCKLDDIAESLKPWCSHSDLKFDSDTFGNGETILTNRVSGAITLKDDVTLLSLPHVFKIINTANKYVLLLISDRPPLCLKCRIVGHIRKYCNMFKCSKCHTLHGPSDSCTSESYLAIVRKQMEYSNKKNNNFLPPSHLPGSIGGISSSLLENKSDRVLSSHTGQREPQPTFTLVTKRGNRKRRKSSVTQVVNASSSQSQGCPSFTHLTDEMDTYNDGAGELISPQDDMQNITSINQNPAMLIKQNNGSKHSAQPDLSLQTSPPGASGAIVKSSSRILKDLIVNEIKIIDSGPDASGSKTFKEVDDLNVYENKEHSDDSDVNSSDSYNFDAESEEEGTPIDSFPTKLRCFCDSIISIDTEPGEGEDLPCTSCGSILFFDHEDKRFRLREKELET